MLARQVLAGRDILRRVREWMVLDLELDVVMAEVRLDPLEAFHAQLLSER
jgi:hypothetical protein